MAFELQLDLTKHCIETEIKRQHRRAVSDYFRADQFSRQNLEQIIEVTRQALESIDFSHMRSTYPALAGHSDARAFLTIENSRIRIVLAGTTLTPLFKNGLP